MGFLRYANAAVVRPFVTKTEWQNIRTAGRKAVTKGLNGNLVTRATEFFGKDFDPAQYVLTHCFPAGHQVLMGDGTEKPIEQVQAGDLVLTHLGNVRPVTTVLSRQVDEELVVLKSASLPDVKCTGEHPFFIIQEDDSWCRVFPCFRGQVKCTFGGKEVCAKHSCLTNGSVPDWVPARDIRVGDRTYTPSLHETKLSFDLNPNRMRLLGYYVAEGRVDYDRRCRGTASVRFALHEDEIPTLGAEIAELMRLEFGVSTHSLIRDRKNPNKGVILAFAAKKFAAWFVQHAGIGTDWRMDDDRDAGAGQISVELGSGQIGLHGIRADRAKAIRISEARSLVADRRRFLKRASAAIVAVMTKD